MSGRRDDDRTRDALRLLGEVAVALARNPTASANEVDAALRADGKGRRRKDVLRVVRVLRSRWGMPQSARGPGRPEIAREPFSRGREEGGEP